MGYRVAEAGACCEEGGIGAKVGIGAGVGIGAKVGIGAGVGIGAKVGIGAGAGSGAGVGIGASSGKDVFGPSWMPLPALSVVYSGGVGE
jgi:UDP-3-O-[3-hydroxymyristoyl] glucosamine N-acyltransferase